MKVYVAAQRRDAAPTMMDLVAYSWAEGINLSYARSGDEVSDSTYVSLGWAKWLDDPEWRGKAKPTEFLNLQWTTLERVKARVSREFLRLSQDSRAHDVLIIDMADDAVTMDKRAFVRAVYLIAKCTEGLIYVPIQKQVLDAERHYHRNQELIESEFSMAFEPSGDGPRGACGTHPAMISGNAVR